MENIIISISLILVGVLIIWYITKKKKTSETPFERGNRFQGIMGGIAFILIGIIKILNDYNLW